jgi:hypothetical protein
MTPYSPLKGSTDLSEEHVATIFRVKEQDKQETNNNLPATCFILVSGLA